MLITFIYADWDDYAGPGPKHASAVVAAAARFGG